MEDFEKTMVKFIGLCLVALAVGLGGCAYAPPAPFIVIGNGKTVSIQWENSTLGSDGALNAAEKHCARYGLKAEFATQVSRFEVIYHCV